MATNPATEKHTLYRAICEIAARCDGALTLDGVGFNGQDTKFGKRIASVPEDQWTDDVWQEAARIALTYKQQIANYMDGLDIGTLDIVRSANGLGTNHNARQQAWQYERNAKNADKVALRRAEALDGKLTLSFHVKDPEFNAIKGACQALETRRFDWDIKAWVTPVSDAAEDIILTYDFNVSDEARRLLNTPRDKVAVEYNINLHPATGRLTIKAPYDPNRVTEARQLPGREWSPPGFDKVDVVNATPEVLEFARRWNLTVHPDATAAVEGARRAMEAQARADLAEDDFRTLMVHVSRLRSPEQLPPAFLELLGEVLNDAS